MAIEREADRIAKAFLLRDLLNEPGGRDRTWKGEVTGLVQGGLFVNFGGGFEAWCPLARSAATGGISRTRGRALRAALRGDDPPGRPR